MFIMFEITEYEVGEARWMASASASDKAPFLFSALLTDHIILKHRCNNYMPKTYSRILMKQEAKFMIKQQICSVLYFLRTSVMSTFYIANYSEHLDLKTHWQCLKGSHLSGQK